MVFSFFLSSIIFLVLVFFLLKNSYYTQRMNVGTRYWWLLFFYGCALNDCTSGCIVANSYWTTLEYDECNVIFHGVCWNGIRVHNTWKYEGAVGCMKNQFLGSFYEKMSLQWTRLSYDTFCTLIKVVGSSFEWKIHTWEKMSMLKLE